MGLARRSGRAAGARAVRRKAKVGMNFWVLPLAVRPAGVDTTAGGPR